MFCRHGDVSRHATRCPGEVPVVCIKPPGWRTTRCEAGSPNPRLNPHHVSSNACRGATCRECIRLEK
jgi:hypothetical protein